MINKKNRQTKLSNIKTQQGWTMWSLMFVIGVLVLFGYIGLKLLPLYTTNSNLGKAMQQTINEVDKSKISRSSITNQLNKQLYIDGNDDLLDYKNELDIKRTQRELVMTVNYERRIDLFYNLSLVATFSNEVKRDL